MARASSRTAKAPIGSDRSKVATGNSGVPGAAEQRRYIRYERQLRARIFRRGKNKKRSSFEATIHTRDISVGGVFLESTFFLKKGLDVELEFELPELGQTVHVAGEVVHIIAEAAGPEAVKPTGFAIRFTQFFGDSEVYLRAVLARGDVYEFVERHGAKLFPKLPKSQRPRMVELIMRWEIYQDSLA